MKEKKHISDGAEEIYYIIRKMPPGAGFFSNYFYVLSHIAYADQNGYIPVVDMENYKTLYQEKHPVQGEKNVWYYYFQKNCDLTLKEIKKKNYILSGVDYKICIPGYCLKNYHFPTPQMVSELNPYIEKYMKVKPQIEQEVQKFIDEKFKGKVLGVHVRGTDWKAMPRVAPDEYRMPETPENVIEKVRFLCSQEKIETIFLSTDEEEVCRLFQLEFQEQVVMNSVMRQEQGSEEGVHFSKSSRENHHYLLGKEVLEDVMLLSRCDYLLCGDSNVAFAAIVINGNRYKKIIMP